MKSLRFSRKQLGIPYALFLLIFVVFPLVLIILYAFTEVDPNGKFELSGVKVSFTFANFIDFFSKSSNIRVLFISLGLAVVTTVICLIIAYPLSYILARSNLNKNGVLLLLFVLPMWINFVLRTAAMKELLFAIGMYSSNKLSFVNTVIGMVYDYLPFVILPLYTVMIKLDKSLLEASADLGAKPASTFFRITLPLTVPGIVSAVTMVFLPTTTSYVVSDTLGNGNVTIIGKIIESQFSTMFNWHAGSAIAMVLLVVIFATMLITNKFTDDDSTQARGNGLW